MQQLSNNLKMIWKLYLKKDKKKKMKRKKILKKF